ncbi:MAG TPA: hypothetical protein DEB40_12975 [Elusimicrobia bacterium]|nr:hypothetical protein [Elusimicrobiota bacterium]HBT62647.1 hypothetical protein [Elusimicrobiota bacterium]
MLTQPQQPGIWFVSGFVLLLYIAAVAIVFLLIKINDRMGFGSSDEEPLPPAAIVALAFVSNLLGVSAIVLLADALSTGVRLSMLALPLLLLIERYGMRIRREAAKWRVHGSALAGSAAGLAAGAWLFMLKRATTEPLRHAVVPGDVRTVPVSELLGDKGTWTVSLQLVAFYLVSVAIFLGLHALLKRMARKLMACPAKQRGPRTALSILIAFVANFLGVFILVFLANASNVQTRLAMVAFPLFLIAESYVKLLRAEPQNRPSHWTGLIGSGGGMALAAFFLLRGAPLH